MCKINFFTTFINEFFQNFQHLPRNFQKTLSRGELGTVGHQKWFFNTFLGLMLQYSSK